jgi:transcriptional regulator with XRE-family HTH domain
MIGERIKKMLYCIRKRREGLSYSQEYMAMRLNISQKGYSKIELNVVKLTADRLLEICDILEIDVAEVLGCEETKVLALKL